MRPARNCVNGVTDLHAKLAAAELRGQYDGMRDELRTANEQLDAAEARIAELEGAIRALPHAQNCATKKICSACFYGECDQEHSKESECDCPKRILEKANGK